MSKGQTAGYWQHQKTNEEIGVLPKIIELLGNLSTIFIPFSGFNIYPYVGWAESAPDLQVAEDEVEKIIEVSVDELIDDTNQRKKNTTIRGVPVTMPYFNLNNEIVWGATSMILSEFKEIIN